MARRSHACRVAARSLLLLERGLDLLTLRYALNHSNSKNGESHTSFRGPGAFWYSAAVLVL